MTCDEVYLAVKGAVEGASLAAVLAALGEVCHAKAVEAEPCLRAAARWRQAVAVLNAARPQVEV